MTSTFSGKQADIGTTRSIYNFGLYPVIRCSRLNGCCAENQPFT